MDENQAVRGERTRPEPGVEVDRAATRVLECAIEVHRILGPGLLESTYEEALTIELRLREVPFARQVPVALSYKGHTIGQGRLDLLVGSSVIVELKAVEKLLPIHRIQLRNYLIVTGLRVGLLINFNVPVLLRGVQRILRAQP